jgi:glycosyltransferase involved in cell wall biosynthesis
MAEPLVSVVIPCYNAERYIAATIRSVLAQDVEGMEVIVVDDGSRDGSVDLVRATFPQVRVVTQANAGVAAARNHGLRLARGAWVAFVDADDIWLPGKLQAQFKEMAEVPGCRMSYTAWQVWHCQEPEPDPAYLADVAERADDSRWRGASGWIYPQLLLDCVVWTSTVLGERSLFEEVGGFDENLRVGEDYDLWLRISRVTPIHRVARPYALYRMHPTSITRSLPTANYRAIVIGRALANWGMRSPDGAEADRGEVKRLLAKSWSDYAGAHLAGGSLATARSAGWTALRTDPAHVPGWKVLIKSYALALAPGKGETT